MNPRFLSLLLAALGGMALLILAGHAYIGIGLVIGVCLLGAFA